MRRISLLLIMPAVCVAAIAMAAPPKAPTTQAGQKTASTSDRPQAPPNVALRPCCKRAEWTRPLKPAAADGKTTPLAAQASGAALPIGHPDDVYYAGSKARLIGTKIPAGYRFGAPSKTPSATAWSPSVDLARRYPKLKKVAFAAFHSGADGRRLTDAGHAGMEALLHARFGATATLHLLGQGGHQVAWRVCRSKKACIVVKIRKVPVAGTAAGRLKAARDAADKLRRDLAVAAVAEQVTSRARWLDAAGGPAELRVAGSVVKPPQAPAGPPGRLARVARILEPDALAGGILEEELISFSPSNQLKAMFEGMTGPDGPLRDKAWQEAPKAGINRVLVLGFLDRYDSVAHIGPEVRHLVGFVRGCRELAKVPTIAAFCGRVRQEFRIPDDFEQRLVALEQMYRDSAGAVIRFCRANFAGQIGNPGADGQVREIGLDYNHGRNVGWDPQTGQFVLFDW